MLDELVRHLRTCCLQVMGERPGCGFFVSPNTLVTCAHVLGTAAAGGGVKLRRWTPTGVENIESARVVRIFPEDDLAILQSPIESQAFVPLDPANQIQDPLVAIGFPRRGDREEFDQFTATYEGQTQFLSDRGRFGVEEKFKAGQVEPGFSGGPLLNLRSRRVTAVVVATRDRSSDLGGWAVEARVLQQKLKELGIKLPEISATWQRAEQLADNAEANLKARPRNPFFVGRESVFEQLDKALAARGRAALSGLGGIGKTQTAVEYAQRNLAKYEHAFWANAASRDALVDSYVKIAALLGLPEADLPDHAFAVAAVRQRLSASESWLLLLDNVDDLALARDFIPPRNGHVLLTTRASALGGLAELVEIQEMNSEEGALFLLRRTGYIAAAAALDAAVEDDRETAQTIVARLGGLPLALDQAAAYIEQSQCALSDYLVLYQARAAELLRRRGGLPFDHPDPVARTWALSFDRIEQNNPSAAELLRCCAVLEPPDGIPEEMFTERAQQLGPVLGKVASDPLAWNDVLVDILKYSLLRRDRNTRTLSIHRLVQAVLRDDMDQTTRDLWTTRAVDALAYQVHPETISPDGKYGIIYCSDPGIARYEVSRMRNYLVTLAPFRIVGALEGEVHYRSKNRSYLSAVWSDDGAAALVTFESRWGPGAVILIETADGALNRQTDLEQKAKTLLEADFQKCGGEPYNEHVPFVVATQNYEDEEWCFDGSDRVRIDCTGETNPKHLSRDKSWAARLQATWDINNGAFTQTKVSRILCGFYAEEGQ